MGAHWYDKQANPRHFEGPNGKGTTLREARKLDLYPSVTTVQNIRDAYNLNVWKQKQAAFRALEMPTDNPDDAWAEAVIRSAKADVTALADDGKDIHKAIEKHLTGRKYARQYRPICEQVEAVIIEHCGEQQWQAETYFCSPLGYAGQSDIHCPTWVLDAKTKDGDVSELKGWPNQAEQLAAYSNGHGIPNARTANVFISRDRALWGQPEAVSFYEHKDDNAWNRFYHTLLLWQIEKKYGPLWEKINGGAA